MVVKMIAMGVFWEDDRNELAYFSDGWNILDFFIVMVSIIDFLITDSTKLKALKALRAFRALRPLRMISRNEGLKLIVDALLTAIPALGNVLMVCSLFIFVFAIVGINIFGGKFW
mmetsp:Transcript_75812/g.164111  ORF Transcript_75812/g.164111 Transcript_75812/m.164111 type:complete len:115 (-) Transcript_75812:70-414(-)